MPIGPRMPLLVLTGAAEPVRPSAPNRKAQAAALKAADEFAIPLYRRLSQAADAQAEAWAAFARTRRSGDFEGLRSAYHRVADAWAEAQIIRTGPITLFLRYERFAYWPEARNATGRALAQLLASKDPQDLAPESLVSNSVAGQGLTALERLLYEGDDPGALFRLPVKDGEWRTQVGLGLARNLGRIARDVLSEWTAADGMRAAIAANTGWKNLFADGAEAARLLLTDLVGAFRLMHDVKLLPVLGASVDQARPTVAEAWRSARSQRNLRLNLLAAQAMEKPFGQSATAAYRRKIDELFAAALKAIDAVPQNLGEAAADPMRRPLVEALRTPIKAVQTEIATVLPGVLGITLGFNSLDGD